MKGRTSNLSCSWAFDNSSGGLAHRVTYEYVIEMLGVIFGYNKAKGFLMACEVDAKKRVIVWTGHLEVAELKQQQIHEYGPDWRMKSEGSMGARLEQAR